MYGFFNRLLRVDLSAGVFAYEEIPDEVQMRTLGGKGLGTFLLARENPKGVDPSSPDNVFIITVGPVTGTKIWSQSRFAAFTKSPATGGFGESYCGGTLAPKIKGCGVDAVILTGAAPRLTYLLIDETGVRFEDASAIEGAETFDAEAYILDHAPEKAGAMVIGPAGEHRVASALHQGGPVAEPGPVRIRGRAGREAHQGDRLLRRHGLPHRRSGGHQGGGQGGGPEGEGIPGDQDLPEPRHAEPGGGHQRQQLLSHGILEGRSLRPVGETSPRDYMQRHFEVKANGCPNCFLRCTKHSVIKHGRHAGLALEGPEFETIYAIGGLNRIDSLEEIAWLNDRCDRLGLDTMSAGNLSAFTAEAIRAGATIDFPIDDNQPDRCAELYRRIAFREGIGDLLADGIKTAARKLGMEDLAIHVKGLEPGGFDPRVLKGMGLSLCHGGARGLPPARHLLQGRALRADAERADPGKGRAPHRLRGPGRALRQPGAVPVLPGFHPLGRAGGDHPGHHRDGPRPG